MYWRYIYYKVHVKVYKTNDKKKNIKLGRETFTSDMLLRYDLNKWRLTKLEKLQKLYIYEESIRI